MGLCTPDIPTPADPADAAVGGINADITNSPFNYLINAAAQMGKKITIDGKTYDFTGLSQDDTTVVVSDQLAQTLLDLQKEKSPAIIEQRLKELEAADPKGYAARQDLFDQILADAQRNPDQGLSTATNQLIQQELDKGVGFADTKQKQEVQDAVRGTQVGRGIYRGNTATREEAGAVVGAGEALRNQRQQDALNLVQSGSTPEDIAYRQMQQTLANLASFVNGQTPTAQFEQVSAAQSGPVQMGSSGVNTNLFNSNAASNGVNTALTNWSNQTAVANNTPNLWLSGLSTAVNAAGTANKINNWWGT